MLSTDLDAKNNRATTHTQKTTGYTVQLDHLLTRQQWKSSVHNITTKQGTSLNSNHYLVKATIHIKRAAPPEKHSSNRINTQASKEDKQKYNKCTAHKHNTNPYKPLQPTAPSKEETIANDTTDNDTTPTTVNATTPTPTTDTATNSPASQAPASHTRFMQWYRNVFSNTPYMQQYQPAHSLSAHRNYPPHVGSRAL